MGAPGVRRIPLIRGQFERTQNHWWWRPGWGMGVRFYTFHLTFEDAPELRAEAERLQAAMTGLTAVDLVPIPWLHLTMTGLGFESEVDSIAVDRVIDRVFACASGVEVTPLVFDRLFLSPEGIMLAAATPPWLAQLKECQAAAVAEVGDETPADDEFHPHVTLAYFSGEVDTDALVQAVEAAAPRRVEVEAPNLSLLELGRDDRVYTWRVAAQHPLSSPA